MWELSKNGQVLGVTIVTTFSCWHLASWMLSSRYRQDAVVLRMESGRRDDHDEALEIRIWPTTVPPRRLIRAANQDLTKHGPLGGFVFARRQPLKDGCISRITFSIAFLPWRFLTGLSIPLIPSLHIVDAHDILPWVSA